MMKIVFLNFISEYKRIKNKETANIFFETFRGNGGKVSYINVVMFYNHFNITS